MADTVTIGIGPHRVTLDKLDDGTVALKVNDADPVPMRVGDLAALGGAAFALLLGPEFSALPLGSIMNAAAANRTPPDTH